MISLPYSHHRGDILSRLFVIKKQDIDDWYLKSHEQTIINKIVWVPVILNAKIFISEQEVEEFKYHHMKERKCDIIYISSPFLGVS